MIIKKKMSLKRTVWCSIIQELSVPLLGKLKQSHLTIHISNILNLLINRKAEAAAYFQCVLVSIENTDSLKGGR